MMFTEEQFTTAMERAVDKRGRDWKYPSPETAPPGYYVSPFSCPTYSDHEGNGTCLVGAAMQVLGMHLPGPTHSPSAYTILHGYLPSRAIMAARCAQVHQDQRHTWGESLEVYKIALEMCAPDLTMYDCDRLYRSAVARLRGEKVTESVERMSESLSDLSKAFAGIPVVSMASATKPLMGKVTFGTGGITITGLTYGTVSNWSGGTIASFIEPQPTKAEHALIA